jgi:hypothetical protein
MGDCEILRLYPTDLTHTYRILPNNDDDDDNNNNNTSNNTENKENINNKESTTILMVGATTGSRGEIAGKPLC